MNKPIILSENRDFKGVWIPAELYLNTDLSPIEKFLIIEIDSLSKNGECHATNQHFADFLGLSQSRTRHIVADLINRGYLKSRIIYKKNSKQVEKRILSVVFKTPPSDFSRTPMSENSHTPPSENSTDKNTYINNTSKSNTDIKFRNNNNNTINNNEPYIIPKIESDLCQPPHYNIYKENLIDIHNNEQLAHILENVTSIPKGNEGHDYIYFLFSTFAKEYKKHKGYKHKRIDCEKLLKYADKLIKFTPMNLNTGESYPEKCNYSFSIFNYEKEDIEYMVKDFFAADICESDHSLHLFMSDNILRARFWRLENKYAEASSY